MLGAHFADASRLEAASVHAFQVLRREMEALGAPPDIGKRARDAERDEVRHARTTQKLAFLYGAERGAWCDSEVVGEPRTRRSVEEIALENAVEGCVSETFGALVAAWQAEHATDARIRRTMSRIAQDEARHAALAWSVAAFLNERLDDPARARVDAAMREAIMALRPDASIEPDPALVTSAGFPRSDDARRLWAALYVALWSPALRGASRADAPVGGVS